jgi:hypothetical protein
LRRFSGRGITRGIETVAAELEGWGAKVTMEPTFAVSVTIVVVEIAAVGGVMAFIPTLLIGDYFIL